MARPARCRGTRRRRSARCADARAPPAVRRRQLRGRRCGERRRRVRLHLGSAALPRPRAGARGDQGAPRARVPARDPDNHRRIAALRPARIEPMPVDRPRRGAVRDHVHRCARAVGPRQRTRRLHRARSLRVVARRSSRLLRGWHRRVRMRGRRSGARQCDRVERRRRCASAQRLSAAVSPLRVGGDRALCAPPDRFHPFSRATPDGRRPTPSPSVSQGSRRRIGRVSRRRSAVRSRGR